MAAQLSLDCREDKELSLLRSDQSCSGTHPTSYLMSTGTVFLAVMRLVRDADYSRPAGNEIKNAWSYITNSPTLNLPS